MFGPPTPASTQPTRDTELSPILGTVKPTRHVIYYNTGVPDPIILQVDNKLYRQSFHHLARHILFLQRMRELPPPSEGHQGASDDNPIHFLDVSASTFDLVLSILDLSVYSEAGQGQLSIQKVLDVLQFCDKWDAPGVQDYCINYLDRAVAARELHPMLAFSLGQKFNRRFWLRDALTKIQRMPISTWINDSTILSWMSPHDMIIALRLREHMHLSRLELIRFRPEAAHTDSCRNPQECSFLWELTWSFSIVPRIAHNTYNAVDLYLFIKDLEVEGMGKGCAKASRDAAAASGRFYPDIEGVDKALELI